MSSLSKGVGENVAKEMKLFASERASERATAAAGLFFCSLFPRCVLGSVRAARCALSNSKRSQLSVRRSRSS